MQGENGERWRTLCEQAAIEQNPHRLLELIAEINGLLYEKERRLMRQEQQTDSKARPENYRGPGGA